MLRHCNGLGLAASTSDGLGGVEQKNLVDFVCKSRLSSPMA